MAAVSPHEYPLTAAPAGMVPENFPEGTLLLAPADPIEAAAPGTYNFSRRLVLQSGIYSVRSQADDSCTFWLGVDEDSVRLLHGHVGYDVVSDWTFQVEGGVYRLNVIVTNTNSGVSEGENACWFALAIRRAGQDEYLSSAEGWLVDTAPIGDADLEAISDTRRSLPVFSILPNWKSGVTERLEWMTDVMPSTTGAEQRRSVRAHPRRSFEAQFMRQRNLRSRLDHFLVSVGRGEFLLPLWHEAVKMTNGITPGASGVSFPTASAFQREFREGDLVFVYNGDPAHYDVLEVGTVFSLGFGWATSPANAWPPGTRIFPMREARILEAPTMSNITDTVATITLRFELSKPDPRSPSWGGSNPTTPLFNFTPDRVAPITLQHERVSYTLDNQAGPIQVTDPGGDGQVAMRMNLTLFGRNQVDALRRMLAAARGRAVAFTTPDFLAAIEARSAILPDDGYIEVLPCGLTEYPVLQQPVRRQIVLFLKVGGPLYRNVTHVEPVFNGGRLVAERLFVDDPLPTIELRNIVRISYAVPARLDQDVVEIHHVVDISRAVQVTLMLRQLHDRRTLEP